MTDALIGTRKGLFALDGDELDLVGFAGVPVTAVARDRPRSARYTPPSTTVTSGSRSTARATVARRSPRSRRPPTPTGPRIRRHRSGARRRGAVDDVIGVDHRAWPCRRARCVVGGHDPRRSCSVPPIAATPGTSSVHCGTNPTRIEWFGGGYDHPGIHSIDVDPRQPGNVLVGISCGGAWRTTDGGAAWRSPRRACAPATCRLRWPTIRPSRTRIASAACREEPDVVWCQHHNGIFRSTDRGRRGARSPRPARRPSGFAVAAHPTDPEMAWFMPATSDEVRIPVDGQHGRHPHPGRRAELRRARQRASRRVNRATSCTATRLDIDDTGERLLFGSTTGGLWTTEDGGDSFRELSAGLPPVNCVAYT